MHLDLRCDAAASVAIWIYTLSPMAVGIPVQSRITRKEGVWKMRTIALEEHYATQTLLNARAKNAPLDLSQFDLSGMGPATAQLCDLDSGRIAAMDEARIDVQVLSMMAPGAEQFEAAEAIAITRDANDQVADAVKRHPTRFGGFAALPTRHPMRPPTNACSRRRSRPSDASTSSSTMPASRGKMRATGSSRRASERCWT